jgi:hypothetical protein
LRPPPEGRPRHPATGAMVMGGRRRLRCRQPSEAHRGDQVAHLPPRPRAAQTTPGRHRRRPATDLGRRLRGGEPAVRVESCSVAMTRGERRNQPAGRERHTGRRRCQSIHPLLAQTAIGMAPTSRNRPASAPIMSGRRRRHRQAHQRQSRQQERQELPQHAHPAGLAVRVTMAAAAGRAPDLRAEPRRSIRTTAAGSCDPPNPAASLPATQVRKSIHAMQVMTNQLSTRWLSSSHGTTISQHRSSILRRFVPPGTSSLGEDDQERR